MGRAVIRMPPGTARLWRLATLTLVAVGWLGLSPGMAATLRHEVVLRGEKVHLSDLFDGVSPDQDTVLGEAPALGKSYEVSGPQLTAIAAQYGIDWPDASPLVSVTVRRGAHVYGHDYAMSLLQAALHVTPRDPDTELVIDHFDPLVVPLDIDTPPHLVQVNYSGVQNGSFSAVMTIDGDTPLETRVSGQIVHQVQALTVRHTVQIGEPITADNLIVSRMRADQLPVDSLHDPEEAMTLTARVPLTPDRPLTSAQLLHPMLVHKDNSVVMIYNMASLRVTASGIALADGIRNDMVEVLNPSTKMVITGRVTDRSQIEILPGAMPVPMDNRMRASAATAFARRS